MQRTLVSGLHSTPAEEPMGMQDFLGATAAQLENLRADTQKSFSVGALPNGTLTQPALFAPACNLHEIIDSLLMATSSVRTHCFKMVDIP